MHPERSSEGKRKPGKCSGRDAHIEGVLACSPFRNYKDVKLVVENAMRRKAERT